jgi:uncharacterized protein
LIAVDTNILIYAHRQDSPWHNSARTRLRSLSEGSATWAITWPTVHEFLSIATNRKIYRPPSTIDEAITQMRYWMQSPSLELIAEHKNHWDYLQSLALNAAISGGQFYHARIAAICLQHGVSELWTADRDFSLFPALKTRNPLVS